MNNAVFGKMIENVRNHRDIKLIVTEERRKKLVSEPNHESCKVFSEDLMAIEMRKTSVLMNKPIPVGQAILDISKTLMYDFRYDYIKPKYGDKAKLCYMDTDSFMLHIKTEDFFKDIADDVKIWFDTSKYDENDERSLPIGVNKKVIGMFKDELNGKIMLEFIALMTKTYAFTWLKSVGCVSEKKKAKGTKKCVVKKNINFDLYKKALFNNEEIKCTQQRFRSDHQQMNTERIHKTALNNKDNKRLQTFDGITTYPIGRNAFKVCEQEMLVKKKLIPIPLYY